MSASIKKPYEPTGFVLHTFNLETGKLEDVEFLTLRERDDAAELYLRLNPGKPIWKTNMRIKR